MNLSDSGINLLKDLEGFRAKPYPDSGGKMTVGYGHLIVPNDGVCTGDIIDPVKAIELLHHDVASTEEFVTNIVEVALEQHQFDALVIFAYNVGCHAFSGSTLLRMLNAGATSQAAQQFLRWDMVGGTHVPGLRNRRLIEQNLFINGYIGVNEDVS